MRQRTSRALRRRHLSSNPARAGDEAPPTKYSEFWGHKGLNKRAIKHSCFSDPPCSRLCPQDASSPSTSPQPKGSCPPFPHPSVEFPSLSTLCPLVLEMLLPSLAISPCAHQVSSPALNNLPPPIYVWTQKQRLSGHFRSISFSSSPAQPPSFYPRLPQQCSGGKRGQLQLQDQDRCRRHIKGSNLRAQPPIGPSSTWLPFPVSSGSRSQREGRRWS